MPVKQHDMITQAPSTPDERPSPMDLSHHFSEVTKRRGPSFLRTLQNVYAIPGMKNLSGGLFALPSGKELVKD
jgi:hypothetical protein